MGSAMGTVTQCCCCGKRVCARKEQTESEISILHALTSLDITQHISIPSQTRRFFHDYLPCHEPLIFHLCSYPCRCESSAPFGVNRIDSRNYPPVSQTGIVVRVNNENGGKGKRKKRVRISCEGRGISLWD